VRPKAKAIPKNEQALGRVYSLKEFEVKGNNDSHYMPSESYDRVYLIHTQNQQRQTWGIFFEGWKHAYFYVVSPINNKSLNTSLKGSFSAGLKEYEREVDYCDWEVWGTHYFQDPVAAVKQIEKRL